jgi:hypothetical protein
MHQGIKIESGMGFNPPSGGCRGATGGDNYLTLFTILFIISPFSRKLRK